MSVWRYRLNVVAETMTLVPDVDVDARFTLKRTNGTEVKKMFEADRSTNLLRWPVLRLRADSRTEVVLMSSRFFSLTTHWIKCTLPCAGDGCRLCQVLPARGLFYLAVTCDARLSILELGGYSASFIEQHAKLFHGGFAPGLVCELSRKGSKQPVRSEVLRVQTGVLEVPMLELATHVMALYKFPCPNPGDDIEQYERRCRQIASIRCDRAAESLIPSSKHLAR